MSGPACSFAADARTVTDDRQGSFAFVKRINEKVYSLVRNQLRNHKKGFLHAPFSGIHRESLRIDRWIDDAALSAIAFQDPFLYISGIGDEASHAVRLHSPIGTDL
jgi:hypothetical protein